MPTRVFIVAHLDEVIDGEVGERIIASTRYIVSGLRCGHSHAAAGIIQRAMKRTTKTMMTIKAPRRG
jgi:hypothetical protein